MKLTPKTYVVFPTTKEDKAAFYKTNLLKTADLLESLPNSRHSQKGFGIAPSEHSCGTVGCALGLAAMYNIIDGLQYRVSENRSEEGAHHILSVVNGEASTWRKAAYIFFGDDAGYVFYNTTATKKQTIAALRSVAKQMEKTS